MRAAPLYPPEPLPCHSTVDVPEDADHDEQDVEVGQFAGVERVDEGAAGRTRQQRCLIFGGSEAEEQHQQNDREDRVGEQPLHTIGHHAAQRLLNTANPPYNIQHGLFINISAATAGRSRKKCRDKIEASVGFVSHLSRLYLGFKGEARRECPTGTRHTRSP